MGYLQSKLVDDLCVNDIVRPTRIPPRQLGAARPCSTQGAVQHSPKHVHNSHPTEQKTLCVSVRVPEDQDSTSIVAIMCGIKIL